VHVILCPVQAQISSPVSHKVLKPLKKKMATIAMLQLEQQVPLPAIIDY